MSEAVLQVRGLTRAYETARGPLEVLRGVDLDVAAGEMLGLVGPSGSGKSSLLHAAGLLERPTGGQVLIDGRPCEGLGEAERTALRLSTIGFVYQFHHLLPEFDAVENVAMPLLMAGRPRREARARAVSLLERLGLGGRLDHRPPQLSGGEQQRIAVARALANSPRLLLADEPTGNLDPATSEAVFGQLRELVRENGVAAVIATHNLEMTRHMDRVVTLREGRLVPAQPPSA